MNLYPSSVIPKQIGWDFSNLMMSHQIYLDKYAGTSTQSHADHEQWALVQVVVVKSSKKIWRGFTFSHMSKNKSAFQIIKGLGLWKVISYKWWENFLSCTPGYWKSTMGTCITGCECLAEENVWLPALWSHVWYKWWFFLLLKRGGGQRQRRYRWHQN